VFPAPEALSSSAGAAPLTRAVVFISQGSVDPNAATDSIREAIAKVMRDLKAQSKVHLLGVASAAAGGDLLFHDVCAELGVESRVYLPTPADQFRAQLVSPGGRAWEDKFDALVRTSRHETLSDSGGWQVWLWADPDYGPVERANAWLVHAALALDPVDLTILTLSDGLHAERPGARQLPNLAARHRAKLVTISLAEVRQAGTASTL
jgi:hypothetical protein